MEVLLPRRPLLVETACDRGLPDGTFFPLAMAKLGVLQGTGGSMKVQGVHGSIVGL